MDLYKTNIPNALRVEVHNETTSIIVLHNHSFSSFSLKITIFPSFSRICFVIHLFSNKYSCFFNKKKKILEIRKYESKLRNSIFLQFITFLWDHILDDQINYLEHIIQRFEIDSRLWAVQLTCWHSLEGRLPFLVGYRLPSNLMLISVEKMNMIIDARKSK